jgi:hypothetical protein
VPSKVVRRRRSAQVVLGITSRTIYWRIERCGFKPERILRPN